MNETAVKARNTIAVPNQEEKLRELILYIAEKCADDPTFGRVKLNKILYYTDVGSYLQSGTPVTGILYRKAEHGPMAADFDSLTKRMIADGELASERRQRYRYTQSRMVALRRPKLRLFSAEEMAVIDAVICELEGHTAKDVSEASHGRAWKIAGFGEAIPYEAGFISDEPVTEYDVALAKQLCRQYQWDVQ